MVKVQILKLGKINKFTQIGGEFLMKQIISLVVQVLLNFKKLFSKKGEKTAKAEAIIKQPLPEQDKEDTKMKAIDKYTRSSEPYSLSSTSRSKLDQCCDEIKCVIEELLHYMDVSVIEGSRSKEEQEKYFSQGTSKARYGQSPHNYNPSYAVDIVPYPIPKKSNGQWDDDSPLWDDMSFLVAVISEEKDIELTWGGDFSTIVDKPHFELTGWRSRI